MPAAPIHGTARGLTLVELLVVLAMLAILLSLAVPGMTHTLRSWQRDAAVRAFVSHLQLARTTAIKASRRVTMCASANGLVCAGNTNWMQGWIVFVDENADRVPDAGRPVLAVQHALSGLQRMQANNAVSWFAFLPPGIMPARATTVTIEPLGAASVDMSTVTISSIGRVRTQKVSRQP